MQSNLSTSRPPAKGLRGSELQLRQKARRAAPSSRGAFPASRTLRLNRWPGLSPVAATTRESAPESLHTIRQSLSNGNTSKLMKINKSGTAYPSIFCVPEQRLFPPQMLSENRGRNRPNQMPTKAQTGLDGRRNSSIIVQFHRAEGRIPKC